MKVIEHISFFPDLFSMKSKTNTGIFLFISFEKSEFSYLI